MATLKAHAKVDDIIEEDTRYNIYKKLQNINNKHK